MGVFKDEQEVYQYLGKIFETAVEDPDLAPKFKAVGTTIRITLTDPEAVINVDFGNGKVEFGRETTLTPEVEMQMTADVSHRFWLGKVNAAMAIAKGEMRTKGPVAKVLKIVPITKPLFATYERILADADRADLIAAAS